MKIAIIGSGGVGGYFGGKIAHAGYDVTFFARGEHLKQIQTNGLTIKSVNGNINIGAPKATDQIKNIGSADLILIAVKAWQLKELAIELKSIIHEKTLIIPLLNGILAIDELKTQISEQNLIGGLCRIISKIESPGIINHLGVTPTIVFGKISNTKPEKLLAIKEIFDESGIKSSIANDIHAELWKKFIAICVSGLLAVTKTTYGELRELKETRQMMVALLSEIFHLSQKVGIKLETDFLDKTISFIDSFPYDTTSSLTRDIWEGKPSEIEYQNGTVVRLGEKYGIPTPINRFVYYCILPMEIKARNKYIY